MSPAHSTSKALFNGHFQGRRAKWLSLFQRFLARFSAISGLELKPMKTSLVLILSDRPTTRIGIVKIKMSGIEIGLSLRGAQRKLTEKYLLKTSDEIDSDLLQKIKTAKSMALSRKPARKTKGRSS